MVQCSYGTRMQNYFQVKIRKQLHWSVTNRGESLVNRGLPQHVSIQPSNVLNNTINLFRSSVVEFLPLLLIAIYCRPLPIWTHRSKTLILLYLLKNNTYMPKSTDQIAKTPRCIYIYALYVILWYREQFQEVDAHTSTIVMASVLGHIYCCGSVIVEITASIRSVGSFQYLCPQLPTECKVASMY